MRVVCYHMYQVFKPTILNSHSLWLMESQSKSTAKPQSLRQAPVHCDSISKLPVITSRCKSTCDQQNAGDGNPQGSPLGRFAWPCVFPSPAFNFLPAEKADFCAPDGTQRAFAPQHAYLNSDSRSLRHARHASKCNTGNLRAVP